MLKSAILAVSILCIVVAGGIFIAHRAWAPERHNHATKKTATVPSFNKQTYSTTDPTSPWVVVNKQHPLQPKTYAPDDLVDIGNGQVMRKEAAKALAKMIAAAKTAGYALTPDSGYRSYDTQVAVYDSEVRGFGQAAADMESARPGYSEHQTGWAVDLGSDGCNVEDCFSATPGGMWAATNAYKYGFLLRYPNELSDITGYRSESWHFRYIGTLLSNELHTEGIKTLEQFFDIPGGTTYR